MVTKETAYKKISELVQRFEEQYASYKNSDYNETLTRRDFIDPFFKALGWDMDNEQGYAESFREVKHEDKLKIGNAVKAPDYSFRANSDKKLFFVEAKKPSVVIKEDIHPAYQVRRYGWSGKLAISIVTDFEEFAIYDCTKKPLKTDKASVARMKYLTFREYLNEFDFLWDTLARISVLRGSLDKYVQGTANKRGAETVDKDFLKTLDGWRTYLATSLSRDNKELNEEEINFVVQQTIDRIIFLRIAEGRKVEPEGNLQTAITQGDYYQNLFSLFKEADDKYNSGLFDFKKDTISKKLKIDNKVIKTIISELYVPKSQYEFSELSVEILGSAYEQFLGKVIRITPAHHAKIEEKPEVRKAGGVYYTPEYIVEYIVKNTVGKLIEGKTPKEISKIKIVDPACGSGSFLIGAYNYLLNYHKNYYSNNGKPAKGRKEDTLTPEGHLTTAEKKRILLNNIYGVDIDVNAVEVTKLSLLLKCMEGETKASIAHQLSMFHERVLPTLENNIKSGNSLVSTDIYENELFEVDKKTKPFNWEKEFPEVFVERKEEPDPKEELKRIARQAKAHAEKALEYSTELSEKLETVFEPQVNYTTNNKGGFDVVIGNPPYGALFTDDETKYIKSKYSTAVWRVESYLLFIERASKLLKRDGFLGLIIPDTLLNLGFTQPSREFLLRNSRLQEIVGLPSNVFPGATVDTIILLTEKAELANQFNASIVLVKTFGKKQPINSITNPQKEFYVKVEEWFNQNAFNIQIDNIEKNILDKIETGKKTISEFADIFYGIKVYQVGKGKPQQSKKIRDEKPFTSEIQKGEKWLPFYDGKNIGRYKLLWNGNNWLNYGDWLAEPRKPFVFEGEKILIRKIAGKTLIATYISETSYCNTLLFVLKLKDKTYSYKSLLAILNSNLIGWYYKKKFQISEDDTFPQIMIRDILQFPLPSIDKENDIKLNKLVDQLLDLNEEKANTKLQSEIEQIERHIESCEDQINIKVYKLYGLENPK
ncbi:MAG: TaqI-like C-terminal specificity domain-containing protein [Ignavibacteriaceae bacterium]|jgi:type I restriction-modification system DNA methylase subunit